MLKTKKADIFMSFLVISIHINLPDYFTKNSVINKSLISPITTLKAKVESIYSKRFLKRINLPKVFSG